jgi:hypothetical protein
MSSNLVASPEVPQSAPLDAVIEGIAEGERQIARLRAEQAGLVAELDRRIGSGFPDAAREELMVACKITQAQARSRLDTARALSRRLDHTRAALEAGRISFEHAAAMAGATRGLDRQLAALVETEVLGDPRAVTPGQLGWRAREAAARLVAPDLPPPTVTDPTKALTGFWHDDGSVEFGLHLPAPDAAVVATWVTAASVRRGRDDLRPATERRADALVDLIRQALDHGALPAAGDGRRPHVEILADLDRLAPDATGTVQLDGRPVPGPGLRELICEPDLRLSVLDRETLADQGRTHRLVTPALRGRLAVRDQHCRFPGCDVHPRSCRAHHITHWADGGPTDQSNLILMCSRHHAAAHGGWTVRPDPDATVRWASPTGQTITCEGDLRYLVEPEDLTDTELGLDSPDTNPHTWIRPWWELHYLEHRPRTGPPETTASTPVTQPLTDICPF